MPARFMPSEMAGAALGRRADHPASNNTLETKLQNAHIWSMDQDKCSAPAVWAVDLSRSDDDIARGNVVAAAIVHDRLRTALAELEAEIAADSGSSVLSPPDR
jgi:hypothetical protein